MTRLSVTRSGSHRCLIEVGAAEQTPHQEAVGAASMFWGALRRVWDPSCGVSLLVGVDGPAVRVAFDVAGDDEARVHRYAETIRSLAHHTMCSITWRSATQSALTQPSTLVAAFLQDPRREPVVSRLPIGLACLTETPGPWLLRLDLVAPLDRPGPSSDPSLADVSSAEPAEALVSVALYGQPGPAGDAAAALLATDLAGPVSLMPQWAGEPRPIELPAAGLHHLLAIPGRLSALMPDSDAESVRPLAELVRTLPTPHVLLLGTTGSGKSTALVHLGADALEHGDVVLAVDTHDGLMLQHLAAQARAVGRPVLFLDFAASGGPVLDVTEVPPGVGVALWVENLWSLIRCDLWQTMPDDYFGPVGEKAVRTLLALAVRAEWFGLADVSRLLDPSESGYRNRVLFTAGDVEVARSVEREIMPMIKAGDNAALFVAGKFAPFSSGVFREVTSGDGPRAPLEMALERGVSILVHAPASRLGDVPARTLIAAILRRVWLHLTNRGGGPRVTVLLDEWQRYAAGSAITMLTESRKYGVRLVLANQVLTQLSTDLRNTVLGNTGAIACYRLSPMDAHALDGTFPSVSVMRLQTLPRHTIALTRFEDDQVLPGPAPVEAMEPPEPVSRQLHVLGLEDPQARQALLARLAVAIRAAAAPPARAPDAEPSQGTADARSQSSTRSDARDGSAKRKSGTRKS